MRTLAGLCVLGFLVVWAAPPAKAADAVEAELKAAFEKDQQTRGPSGPTDVAGDEARRHRVLELLARGQISTAESRYYAAMILQHTPQDWTGTKFESRSAENYLIAHYLAKSAAEAGHKGARNLAAATYDRYLVIMGHPQKYGTQFTLNPSTGRFEFDRVDPATTDAERAAWDVPPVEETLRRFRESGRDKPRALPARSEAGALPVAPP